MAKKQDIKAIDAWQSENIERIVIKPRKDDHVSERIQIAIDRGIAKSRQAYILDAVKRTLDADGIPTIGEGGMESGDWWLFARKAAAPPQMPPMEMEAPERNAAREARRIFSGASQPGLLNIQKIGDFI